MNRQRQDSSIRQPRIDLRPRSTVVRGRKYAAVLCTSKDRPIGIDRQRRDTIIGQPGLRP